MKLSHNQTKKPCGKRLARIIRQRDIYGHQIGLTYNESKTYKTTLGGVFTIIASIGMLAFLITEIIKVVQRSSTITVTQKIINSAIDNYEIHIDQTKFDFAVRLKYSLAPMEPTIEKNMHQYAYAKATIAEFGWKEENGTKKDVSKYQNLNFTKCGSGRFLGEKESTDVIGIESNFQCLEIVNFKLMGNWVSSSSKMFIITVEKCSQDYLDSHYPGQKCKNTTEIDRVWENIQVLFAQTNQYFDDKDFSDHPIKTSVNFLFFTSHPVLGQSYNYKMTESFAKVSDSWLSADLFTREIPYYKLRFDQQYTKVADQLYNKPIQLNIILDENVMVINRQVYTISDALSAVGGFFGIVVIIIQTLIGFFQENIFYQSLMNKMYIFQDDKENVTQSLNQVGSIFNSNLFKTRLKDGQIDNKKEKFDNLFDQLCRRHPFKISLQQYISGVLCCGKNKNRVQIYKKGIHKIKREFEITNILVNTKKIQLLSSMFLSKYQMALMPYFTANLVTNDNSLDSQNRKDFIKKRLDASGQEDKKSLIHNYLKQAFMSSSNNKIDNRLIKNLDIQYSRQLCKTNSEKGLVQLLNQNTTSLMIGASDANIKFQNEIKQSNNNKLNYFQRSLDHSDIKSKHDLFDNKSENIDKEILDFDTQKLKY